MKPIRVFAFALLAAAGVAQADPSQPLSIKFDSDNLEHPVALLPGSQVVAGDSSKDEFFVLDDKNEANPIQVAADEKQAPPNPKENEKIMLDLNKKSNRKEIEPEVKMASNQVKSEPNKLEPNKKASPTVLLALNKNMTSKHKNTPSAMKVVHKKVEKTNQLPKLKMALNRVLQHPQKTKKVASQKRVALHKKTNHRVTKKDVSIIKLALEKAIADSVEQAPKSKKNKYAQKPTSKKPFESKKPPSKYVMQKSISTSQYAQKPTSKKPLETKKPSSKYVMLKIKPYQPKKIVKKLAVKENNPVVKSVSG